MPSCNVRRNSIIFRSISLLGLWLLFASSGSVPVAAVDTEVGATVCGSTPSAALIDITQPANDSVVNQATLTFRGTVAGASQIVVELNGQYNGTLALANNQTTFEADITLPQGTHTITMRAIEVCGGTDGMDSVVLTYQPAVQPSTGRDTDTTVEPNGGHVGVVTGKVSIPETSIEQLPIIGPLAVLATDLAAAVGLDATLAANQSSPVAGVARVAVTVAALTSVVMASSLAPVAAQSLPGVSELFNANSHRSMLYLGWVIRGVGVLALALAYFL